MTKKNRYSMRAQLKTTPPSERWPTRKAQLEDALVLGKLMERSYRGTIDDEGETLNQFIAETRATMEGKYGPFIKEASFLIEQNGTPLAATIVTLWKEKPLLAFSITDPEHQGKGMASFLIQKTMNAVLDLGHSHLDLAVTEGNKAEHLYRKLGFEIIP